LGAWEGRVGVLVINLRTMMMVYWQGPRMVFESGGVKPTLLSLPLLPLFLFTPSHPSLYPFPSLPLPLSLPLLPSLSIPFPLPPFPFLRSRPPLMQLGGLGERCKLPQWGLGPSPSRNRIWCILALKFDIWWQNNFLENQLTKFCAA